MRKVFGLIIFLIVLIFAAGGNIDKMLDIQSIVLVLGICAGVTLIEYRDNFSRDDLVRTIKKNFIVAGWLGVLTGVILNIEYFDSKNIEPFISNFGVLLLSILYANICAAITEFFIK